MIKNLNKCSNLLVLVRSYCDELRLWEGVAGDHPARASDAHDVDARLVFVQRV